MNIWIQPLANFKVVFLIFYFDLWPRFHRWLFVFILLTVIILHPLLIRRFYAIHFEISPIDVFASRQWQSSCCCFQNINLLAAYSPFSINLSHYTLNSHCFRDCSVPKNFNIYRLLPTSYTNLIRRKFRVKVFLEMTSNMCPYPGLWTVEFWRVVQVMFLLQSPYHL